MMIARRVALLSFVLVAAAACKKKPVVAPTPAPTPAPAPAFNKDSADAAERARADAARRAAEAAANAEREKTLAAARAALSAQIYFDLDQSELSDAAKATLDSKLPVLNANAAIRIRIEGNTDSRGSDEYNLALGQRRAASAKRYLVSRGIAEGRIDAISVGEERPAMTGENEDAWAKNRRDEFVIVVGTVNAAKP